MSQYEIKRNEMIKERKTSLKDVKLIYFSKLENEIKSLYSGEEFAGHSFEDHIMEVVANAQWICNETNSRYSPRLELACLLHDIGLINGRSNHHIDGAEIAEEFIEKHNIDISKSWIVPYSIKYHRASHIGNITNTTAILLSAADRCYRLNNFNIEYFREMIRRCIESNNTSKNIIDDVVTIMQRKFGKNGYSYKSPGYKILNRIPSIKIGLEVQKEFFSKEYKLKLIVEDELKKSL